MFNAERLLGGLIRSSTRGSRGGLGGLASSGAALGALGVAMEAFEHFVSKPKNAGAPPMAPGSVPSMPGAPPPLPPTPGGSSVPPPLPPMPGKAVAPPPSPSPGETPENADAVLLIRAMIAAANADGTIDETERDTILERLRTVDLSPEEQAFITRELFSPADPDAIVAGVNSPELARQVYAVSLMAIEVDTQKERQYMEALASRLNLDGQTVEQLERSLELE